MRLRGILAGLALAAVPGLAAAADAKLTLVIGGEGFDGPPKFAVSFDGKPVGEGTVDGAIDTTRAGRFADAPDRASYVRSFSFTIPDAAFRPGGEVVVRLTNEAHGAVGSKDDRELYVQSVAVNGDAVPAARFGMRSSLGAEPTAMLDGYLVLSATAVEGVVAAPAGGWPKADAGTAAAKPEATEVAKPEVAAAPATPAAAAGPAAAATANAGPAPAAAQAAPEAVAPADKPAAVAAASTDSMTTGAVPEAGVASAEEAGNPDPEASSRCGLTRTFQITGFGENSNELTPRVEKALDGVAKAIGTQQCVVHVTGYSSTEGDYAHNALFSIERSQNALHYLTAKGVKYRRYSANGVGETTQFGPSPHANRRVVVTVSP